MPAEWPHRGRTLSRPASSRSTPSTTVTSTAPPPPPVRVSQCADCPSSRTRSDLHGVTALRRSGGRYPGHQGPKEGLKSTGQGGPPPCPASSQGERIFRLGRLALLLPGSLLA